MSERTNRIDELLREELSSILAREVADPGLGFVTVTRIETARDLGHARVWVSLIGQPAEREATLKALQRALPFARRRLGERLRLRRIPELHVRLDDTLERGTRVLQILGELEAGRTPDVPTDLVETLPTPVRGAGNEADSTDGAAAGEPEAALDATGRTADPPTRTRSYRRRSGGPANPARRSTGLPGPRRTTRRRSAGR